MELLRVPQPSNSVSNLIGCDWNFLSVQKQEEVGTIVYRTLSRICLHGGLGLSPADRDPLHCRDVKNRRSKYDALQSWSFSNPLRPTIHHLSFCCYAFVLPIPCPSSTPCHQPQAPGDGEPGLLGLQYHPLRAHAGVPAQHDDDDGWAALGWRMSV